jgi:hypothetical protein
LTILPLILNESGRLRGRNVNDIILFPEPSNTRAARPAHGKHISKKRALKLVQDISSYPTMPGTQDELYWQTKTLITEVLGGAQPNLADARVDSVLPPGGSLRDNNYVWNGAGSLEATISATDINAAEAQNNYAFLSGVALAIAATSAIALLQELPEAIPLPLWWPRWPRLKRNSNHQRSGGRVESGLGWPE